MAAKSRVRIVGGTWRSRLVEFPDLPGLRPTPDRVRETLFNWLGRDLTGWACLDLFAGSGVLGLEAASRGAAHVTFVENSPAIARNLSDNLSRFGPARMQVSRSDALKFISLCDRSFDLVFVDPPYRQGWIERLIVPLGRLVAPGGKIYVESEFAIETLGEWRAARHGKAGQVHYHLLER